MEEWRVIPSYENYEASNMGRVRSITRPVLGRNGHMRMLQGKEIIPHINERGYLIVGLWSLNKGKTVRVHRLVMMAFFGLSDLVVNHKDGNQLNNTLDNLEYCTQQENIKHAWANGRCETIRSAISTRKKEVV